MPEKGAGSRRGQFRVEISFSDLGPEDIPIDELSDNPLGRLVRGLDREFGYVGGKIKYISRGPRKGVLLEFNLPIVGKPKDRLAKTVQEFLTETNAAYASVKLRGVTEILTITPVDVVESSTTDLPY